VRFEKTGPARYISHLDLQRCVQRTLKLMGAPVRYTEGFNPHPRLSFAQALPMYMESVGEYFILELTRDVNFASFIEGFNAHGYSGIVARGAREMPKEEGNPMNLVRAASYRYEMAGDEAAIKAAIESMMAKEEIIYYKKGKGGLKELNLRARLYELGYENGIVTMLVGCGETNLSPYEVINRLYESIGSEKRVENKDILRTQMYYEDETEGFLPFL